MQGKNLLTNLIPRLPHKDILESSRRWRVQRLGLVRCRSIRGLLLSSKDLVCLGYTSSAGEEVGPTETRDWIISINDLGIGADVLFVR